MKCRICKKREATYPTETDTRTGRYEVIEGGPICPQCAAKLPKRKRPLKEADDAATDSA